MDKDDGEYIRKHNKDIVQAFTESTASDSIDCPKLDDVTELFSAFILMFKNEQLQYRSLREKSTWTRLSVASS